MIYRIEKGFAPVQYPGATLAVINIETNFVYGRYVALEPLIEIDAFKSPGIVVGYRYIETMVLHSIYKGISV